MQRPARLLPGPAARDFGQRLAGGGVVTAVEPQFGVPRQQLHQRPARQPLQPRRPFGPGQSLLDPAVTARVLDRLRTPPPEADELATLTEREREILELIAEGLTNRQIGQRLYLAEKTVKNYVSSLLAKLGLERRTQAAVLASKLLR